MNTLFQRPRTLLSIAVMSVALLGVAGCGGETVHEVEVTGNVTVDGQPVDQGSISFVAADGVARTGGGVIKDGKYVARVAPGEKKVMVLGNKLVGTEPLYKDMPDSPTRDKYEMITPPAYNAAHQTPLKATISESQNGLDFDLDGSFKPGS